MSTKDHVTNENIEKVDGLVNRVKLRKEVSISYMKSWEYEAVIKREATEAGLAEGMAEGLAKGLEKGLAKGRKEIVDLFVYLQSQNRTEDIARALQDRAYLDDLLQEHLAAGQTVTV